jgi:hypothetical protein
MVSDSPLFNPAPPRGPFTRVSHELGRSQDSGLAGSNDENVAPARLVPPVLRTRATTSRC